MSPNVSKPKGKAYKYLLWKSYFDTGLGLTSYVKYILAIFGFYTIKENLNVNYLIGIAITYIIICFIIGYMWYKYKLIHVQNEIGNDFNPFQLEVRERLRKRKI